MSNTHLKTKNSLNPDWIWKSRVIFYYIIIAVLSTAYVIPLLLLSLLGASYRVRYKIAKSYAWAFMCSTKMILSIDYEIDGLENLPKGPCVIMANHQSFWDNVIMPHIFPMQSWVIKKELFDIPVFGLGLRLVEPIAVDRTDSNSVTQILNMGAEKIKAGLWVVIFPEATRVPVGRRVNLKPSGAKLAIENQVPIVLMAHNAGLFWPKGFWVNKSGTIRVKIGPILHPKHGDDVRELTKQIQDWMHHEKDILSGHIEE